MFNRSSATTQLHHLWRKVKSRIFFWSQFTWGKKLVYLIRIRPYLFRQTDSKVQTDSTKYAIFSLSKCCGALLKIIYFCKKSHSFGCIKFWKIFKFCQSLKNLQILPKFEKSSITTKLWKIFNLGWFLKNLHFLPKFEKSSNLNKFW